MKKILFLICVFLVTTGIAYTTSPTITVLNPNGGEKLVMGSSYTINWNASGTTNNFKITLWNVDSLIGVIDANVPAGNGARSYSWTVGNYVGGTASEGKGFKIKIKEKTTSVADMSNSYFKILNPYIYVSFPSGGTLPKGSSVNIEWTSFGTTQNFKVTLWKNDVLVGIINSNVPAGNGKKTLAWTVGDYTGGNAPFGTGYKVKVKEKTASVAGLSYNPFTISNPGSSGDLLCPVKVKRPSKEDGFCIGRKLNIVWNGYYNKSQRKMVGKAKRVRIDIMSTLCKPSMAVAALNKIYSVSMGTEDDGRYSWTIPQHIKPGCYKVKVSRLHRELCSGYSKVFKIQNCVQVLPGWLEKIKAIRRIRVWPPIPRCPQCWKFDINEILEKIGNPPDPVDVELIKGGKIISHLGRLKGKGLVNWNIVQKGNNLLGNKILETNLKGRGIKLIGKGGSGFSLVLKDAKTGKILKTFPVNLEIQKNKIVR